MASMEAHDSSKLVGSAAEALGDVRPGMSVMVGGFAVIHGWPNTLLRALAGRGAGDLTVIANNLGFGAHSPQVLAERRLVAKFVGSFAGFVGRPTPSEQQILAGEMACELVPQGTFVERIRAGGAGIAAFYTPTGIGTVAEKPEKERRDFGGRPHLLETALRADLALLRAQVADAAGNVAFEGAQRNFQAAMATAADRVVVEVERVVPVGELAPDAIHLPGIFVDAVVREEIPRAEVMAEVMALGRDPTRGGGRAAAGGAAPAARAPQPGVTRELMALRAARLIAERGYRYVNLGIGLPTLVGEWLDKVGSHAVLQAENGLLGYVSTTDLEAWDPNYYNAGGQPVAPLPGSATFDSALAFTMARGGHLDAVVLGAFQVSARGDLANWKLPGVGAGGIGGAMDLIAGGSPVIAVMEHTTRDGEPRLVEACTYPLTGLRCVTTIVTNMAVIEVGAGGLVLREVAPGVTPAEVVAATGCALAVPEGVREMEL
ncbi:MAG: 3-oxoacid CoA-transferase subunit A [Chloroflexi bacterium]|nr:3-oxoacid CoA-transferase subunit A [Chloroflexota bacterium]